MSKETTLSEKEMRLLALSWQCMDAKPNIDYDKLANLSGYTRGSASTMFNLVRRKIEKMGCTDTNGDGDTGATSNNELSTPKTSPKKRGPKKAAVDGESPTKKPRATPKKAAGAKGKKAIKVEENTPVKVKQEDDGRSPIESIDADDADDEGVKKEVDDAELMEEYLNPDVLLD